MAPTASGALCSLYIWQAGEKSYNIWCQLLSHLIHKLIYNIVWWYENFSSIIQGATNKCIRYGQCSAMVSLALSVVSGVSCSADVCMSNQSASSASRVVLNFNIFWSKPKNIIQNNNIVWWYETFSPFSSIVKRARDTTNKCIRYR